MFRRRVNKNFRSSLLADPVVFEKTVQFTSTNLVRRFSVRKEIV